MKKLIALSVIITASLPSFSQSVIVWDPFVTSTLVVCHTQQQAELKKIKENEIAILGYQTFISKQVERIKEIEEKLHDRLKNVTSIIKDGANILYAKEIVEDIGKYQGEMVNYAQKDPELLIVAYETEAVLISRTADIMVYLAQAILGGDINLLDNRQRQEMIEYVVKELSGMRGLAYSVARKMRMAKYTGALDYSDAFQLNYPDEDITILEDILSGL